MQDIFLQLKVVGTLGKWGFKLARFAYHHRPYTQDQLRRVDDVVAKYLVLLHERPSERGMAGALKRFAFDIGLQRPAPLLVFIRAGAPDLKSDREVRLAAERITQRTSRNPFGRHYASLQHTDLLQVVRRGAAGDFS